MFKHEALTGIAVALPSEELEVGRPYLGRRTSTDPSLPLKGVKEVLMPFLSRRTHRGILIAILCIAVIGGTATSASGMTAKVTDPRKCSYGPTRTAQCAHAAALLVTRKVLEKKAGLSYLWQGPLDCTNQGTLLKWRCAFADQFPQLPPKGYVSVAYRATSTGWHVYTAIVATA